MSQRKRKWLAAALLALPLAAAGVVYGQAWVREERHPAGYECPLTGEQLPCPKCCPLNAKK